MPILLQLITNLRDRYVIVSRLCMEMPDYSSRSLRRTLSRSTRPAAHETPQLAGDLMRQHLRFALDTLMALLPGILPRVDHG